MIITAKFASRCTGCGRPINTGEYIDRHAITDKWVHEGCVFKTPTAGSGHHRHGQRKTPARPAAGDNWAASMFAELGEPLAGKAYRALAVVLHPDTGGDTLAMQQLTAGWDHYRDRQRVAA